ncbi:hypothetical protein [Lysinibacillus xylanilyticus]|uniref:hypothetical protein n=1 Tax=Lysinibacillus xylanilyticus TaxID=582475 RepID=UPI003D017C89
MIMQLVWEKPDVYKVSQLNQDNLWKKIIADLFEDFLLFFLPELHAEVDFSKRVEFLQQELFKEIIEYRQGRKIADQIAKVHLKDGKEQWILVHTEVQAIDEVHFVKHMFEYFYRISDRYGKKVVAIAIFTNTSTKSTNQYHDKYYGTEIKYTFNFFQRMFKHLLKEVKACGGCHGIGKEFLGDVSLKPSHPCDNG